MNPFLPTAPFVQPILTAPPPSFTMQPQPQPSHPVHLPLIQNQSAIQPKPMPPQAQPLANRPLMIHRPPSPPAHVVARRTARLRMQAELANRNSEQPGLSNSGPWSQAAHVQKQQHPASSQSESPSDEDESP